MSKPDLFVLSLVAVAVLGMFLLYAGTAAWLILSAYGIMPAPW